MRGQWRSCRDSRAPRVAFVTLGTILFWATELGREGKKVGKGFYEYPAGEKKHLWSGLKDLFSENLDAVDADTVGKRLLHIMALESYRCLAENVLRSSKDGDLGSLLASVGRLAAVALVPAGSAGVRW